MTDDDKESRLADSVDSFRNNAIFLAEELSTAEIEAPGELLLDLGITIVVPEGADFATISPS